MEKEIVDKFFDELVNTGIPVKREDVEAYANSREEQKAFQLQRVFENVTIIVPPKSEGDTAEKLFFEKLPVNLTAHCNKTADKMYLNTYELDFQAGQNKMEAMVFKDFRNTYTVKEAFNLMNGGSVTREFYSKEKEKFYTATATALQGERNPSGSLKVKKQFGINIAEAVGNLNIVYKDNQDDAQIIKRLAKGDIVEFALKDELGNINDRLIKVNGMTPSVEIYDVQANLKAEIKQGLTHVVKRGEKKSDPAAKTTERKPRKSNRQGL